MKGLLLRFSCLLLISFIGLQGLYGQVELQLLSDVDGEALIGVTATDDGGEFRDVSDRDGKLLIPRDQIPLTLTCNYVGHEPLVIPITDQSEPLMTVVMLPSVELLDAVEIIGRSQERGDLMPQRIEVISQAQIQSTQSSSSADVLSNSGSVYIQRSQSGGGSPVMRGFEANKVLLVVDGVRLNNLIYRSGHLQNVITVDHSSLENLELIFGPGSLMYGSDALGGVIHFETLRPRYDTKQQISINTQFTSSNLGARLNLTHQYGSDKMASATSVSLGRYDDQRAGRNRAAIYDDFPTYGLTDLYYDADGNLRRNLNPHIQRNSGYSQVDFLQKFKFKLGRSAHLTVNAQLSTSTNIPRYDQLSQVDESGLPLFKQWHYGPQSRLLLSSQLDLTAKTTLYDKGILIASFQDIEESRITQAQSSDMTTTQLEKVKVFGLTADFTKTVSAKLNLNYGLDLHHNILKYALGQGFRAPNIDDLAKIRVKANEITIPNTDLKPERTLNHDLSVKYGSERVVFTAFGYYVTIDDVIVRQSSTLPDGSPIFVDEIGQSLNVTANFNESAGKIYGGGVAVDLELVNNLTAGGKVNLTKGISKEGGVETPLGHIPPLFGWVGLKYESGYYQYTADYHFNGQKGIEDYGGSVDNPEYALPSGAPAWSVVDLGVSRVTNQLVLRASIDNVLDTFYRPFASGISGPGRSYNLSVGLKF